MMKWMFRKGESADISDRLYRLCVQDKMVFLCSTDCSNEYKKANFVTSLCEYCKIEKITREVKRINNKDCYFCSDGKEARGDDVRIQMFVLNAATEKVKFLTLVNDESDLDCLRSRHSGCKLLFRHELSKNWGKHCHSCVYCHCVSKKLVTAQYGGSVEEFCSEECRSKYTMLFCHVRKSWSTHENITVICCSDDGFIQTQTRYFPSGRQVWHVRTKRETEAESSCTWRR